jgi:hypothetical protein
MADVLQYLFVESTEIFQKVGNDYYDSGAFCERARGRVTRGGLVHHTRPTAAAKRARVLRSLCVLRAKRWSPPILNAHQLAS